jgi:hypothetical protein
MTQLAKIANKEIKLSLTKKILYDLANNDGWVFSFFFERARRLFAWRVEKYLKKRKFSTRRLRRLARTRNLLRSLEQEMVALIFVELNCQLLLHPEAELEPPPEL